MYSQPVQLNPKVQFACYIVALACFLVAAAVPAERRRFLGRVNGVALGLAFAIAPMVYIYFKLGFHSSPLLH